MLAVDFASTAESEENQQYTQSDDSLQEQRDIQLYDLGIDFEEPELSEPVSEVCHNDAGGISFTPSAQSDAEECPVTESNDNIILAVDFT